MLALLWFHTAFEDGAEMPITKLCNEIEEAGFGKQNSARIGKTFATDRRLVRGKPNCFRISSKAITKLTEQFSSLARIRPCPSSDSVIESDLFTNAKDYIKKVIFQLNASYDFGLYDCCAVMVRRVLETLIIEAYEAHGIAGQITDVDGHFFMFAGLLRHLESKKPFHLSRNAAQGLKDFKTLGDLSAHNRRFNARQKDVDGIRPELRVACEELLHLAKQGP